MWGKLRKSILITPLKWAFLNLRHAHSRWMDRRWNIDTISATGKKWALGGHFSDDNIYEPVPYLLLPAFAKPLGINPKDVVYDIGCGSGRWLFFFAHQGVQACVGIELSQQLVNKGRDNITRFQNCMKEKAGNVRIEHTDAAQANYDAGTIFVLFNPFGPQTMQAVLERIHASVTEHPRPIQLLYINPKHEDVFLQSGWLKKIHHIHPRFTSTQASIWTNGNITASATQHETQVASEAK